MNANSNSTWPEPPNYYEAPKHGFKVVLETPNYPVINPEPNITEASACTAALEIFPFRGACAPLHVADTYYAFLLCSHEHAVRELGHCGWPCHGWVHRWILLW